MALRTEVIEAVLKMRDELSPHLAAAAVKVQAAGERMERQGKRLARTGDNLTRSVTLPIIGIGAAAFKMATDAQEAANKFDVVMGGSAARVRQRLAELTDTIPLTRSEMEGLAAGIQDMLVPMGVARSRAAGMSADMVELAADLASFNNVGTEEVLEAIQSALAGSSEPMRRFGVDTRVAALQAIALEHGLIQQGQALDNTATAQAVLLAIQKDSTDAQGDAARTMDSAANVSRRFWRDLRQLAETIGQELIPIVQPWLERGSEMLAQFQALSPETKRWIVQIGLLAAAGGPVLSIGGRLLSTFGGLVTGGGKLIGMLGRASGATAKFALPIARATRMLGLRGGLAMALKLIGPLLTGPVGITVAIASALLSLKSVRRELKRVADFIGDQWRPKWERFRDDWQEATAPGGWMWAAKHRIREIREGFIEYSRVQAGLPPVQERVAKRAKHITEHLAEQGVKFAVVNGVLGIYRERAEGAAEANEGLSASWSAQARVAAALATMTKKKIEWIGEDIAATEHLTFSTQTYSEIARSSPRFTDPWIRGLERGANWARDNAVAIDEARRASEEFHRAWANAPTGAAGSFFDRIASGFRSFVNGLTGTDADGNSLGLGGFLSNVGAGFVQSLGQGIQGALASLISSLASKLTAALGKLFENIFGGDTVEKRIKQAGRDLAWLGGISDETANAVGNLAFELGKAGVENANLVAQVKLLGTILKNEGIDNARQFDRAVNLARQAIVLAGAGVISWAEANETLNESFPAIIANLDKMDERGRQALRGIIEEARAAEERIEALDAHFRSFAQEVTSTLGPALDRLEGKLRFGALAQRDLRFAGQTLALTWQELRAQGFGFAEIMNLIGDDMRRFIEIAGQAGAQIPATFETIARLMELTDGRVGRLVESLDMMTSTAQHFLSVGLTPTAQMWKDIRQSIRQTIKVMLEAGATQEDILFAIGPQIGTIIRLHQDFGMVLDANTLSMLDLAGIDIANLPPSQVQLQREMNETLEKMGGQFERVNLRLKRTNDKLGKMVKAIRDLVRELRSAAGGFDSMAAAGARAANSFSGPSFSGGGAPGFSGGTPGTRFVDFGSGVPAVLHGREAVVTEAQGASVAGMVAGAIRSAQGGGGGSSGDTGTHERLETLDRALWSLTQEVRSLRETEQRMGGRRR